MHSQEWKMGSWKAYPCKYQPEYKNKQDLEIVLTELRRREGLVSPASVQELRRLMEFAHTGKAFFIQGGDCSEAIDSNHEQAVTLNLNSLYAISSALIDRLNLPVFYIGRIAGQFFKPRSEENESYQGEILPTYKGDGINSIEKNFQKRLPDPQRLIDAYDCAKGRLSVIDEIRGQTIQNSLPIDLAYLPYFTSHEALHLAYESSLTRQVDKEHSNLSAHMVWIGERTNDIGGGHVEYIRGINNPIGIKVGPRTKPEELVQLIGVLNPSNQVGKITLILRFGVNNVYNVLPGLISVLDKAQLNVGWCSDPMHGNTVVSKIGVKTRVLSDMTSETAQVKRILSNAGKHLAGIHLEMTGSFVTECVDFDHGRKVETNFSRYKSKCDPRLNLKQSWEFGRFLARLNNDTIEAHQYTSV